MLAHAEQLRIAQPGHVQPRDRNCEQNMPQIIAALSDHPVHVLRDLPSELCFSNLLVGVGQMSFRRIQENMGPTWRQYREYTLRGLGVAAGAALTEHCVTLLSRPAGQLGKRTTGNFEEIATMATEVFGVRAVMLNPVGQSMQQLATAMTQTTVLIAPGGGYTCINLWLPPGSAMILIDGWLNKQANPISPRTERMAEPWWSRFILPDGKFNMTYRWQGESSLFDNYGWVRSLFYTIAVPDEELTGNDPKLKNRGYRLLPERIEPLLFQALSHAQRRMRIHQKSCGRNEQEERQ